MRILRTIVFIGALLVLLGAVALALPLFRGGFNARDEPSRLEAVLARRLRLMAIAPDARRTKNPVDGSDAVLREAREHFGDHCAVCHGADGSGETAIGENLFPKAPDMRKAETQSLTDGELFFIIHNGVRYTGMPAWGGAAAEDDRDSWELVHVIRRLPRLAPAELAEIQHAMPKTADEHHTHGTPAHTHGGEGAPDSSLEHDHPHHP